MGDISVDVIQKDIKNVHLSVHPPSGRVRISAPLRLSLETIRTFAISKLRWIKQQQGKLHVQERETPREYLDRESHYVWGRRYLLQLIEENESPRVELSHKRLILHIRPATTVARKEEILDDWYRQLIRETAPDLIAKWQRNIGVSVSSIFVQNMKTKWGSCNALSGHIRLNTELAKKPPHCLEYIVVHELVHFIERHHGDRFKSLMDRYLPPWRSYRDELNRFPLSHKNWTY
ncbi:MAG TPA: SprT family zinc-dependent metalloprotease [Candidatus Angelobacter sp.]|nr:SprT family zinc-dependent metalloprotease [Candidatus Angelobacter sp.]